MKKKVIKVWQNLKLKEELTDFVMGFLSTSKYAITEADKDESSCDDDNCNSSSIEKIGFAEYMGGLANCGKITICGLGKINELVTKWCETWAELLRGEDYLNSILVQCEDHADDDGNPEGFVVGIYNDRGEMEVILIQSVLTYRLF